MTWLWRTGPFGIVKEREVAKNVLRTKLCDMLDIEYPIILAGMGGVCGPTLVAAVSNAGGLGVLGAAGLSADQLRDWIEKTRNLTNKPFGVDLLLPKLDLPPVSGKFPISELKAFLPAEELAFVDRLKREIGIPDVEIPPLEVDSDFLSGANKLIDVILEERVPVFASGLGNPEAIIPRAHAQGMKVVGLVGNVRNARRVANAGVDIIVAQGHEAGGHTDRIGTLALVPQVVDAVKIPVVAAGGIADARGLVAALALGAEGILMGTRFLATHECSAHPDFKQAVLRAIDTDTIPTGRGSIVEARVLKNEFARQMLEMESAKMSAEELVDFIGAGRIRNAIVEGDMKDGSALCGAIAGMIKEIVSAGEVMRSLVDGYESIVSGLK